MKINSPTATNTFVRWRLSWRPSALHHLAPRVLLVIALGVLATEPMPVRAADNPPERSAAQRATLTATNRQAFDDYENGRLRRAVSGFRKAARLGEPSAQYNLAVIHIRGESRAIALGRALGYLRASANAGFAPAQFMLASLLENGQLLAKSVPQATAWYEKAAEQGNVDAAMGAAVQYFLGRGVTQDYARAARWYQVAAQGGDVAAQYIVASLYEYGNGVDKDLQQALEWYTAAARQGDVAAREKSKVLAQQLAGERS
jgi:uncharacterized protein